MKGAISSSVGLWYFGYLPKFLKAFTFRKPAREPIGLFCAPRALRGKGTLNLEFHFKVNRHLSPHHKFFRQTVFGAGPFTRSR